MLTAFEINFSTKS